MARSTSRRTASTKRVRYSVENTGVQVALGADLTNGLRQTGQVIVPATSVQGTRTVRHLTISLSDVNDTFEFWYALVYVPEGYNANGLFPDFANTNF